MTATKRIAIPAALLLVALVAVAVFQFRPGIQVTVVNTGTTPLKSVILHVTGTSGGLGDIGPGNSATAHVHATGESHLEIAFIGADGQPQRLVAGGYFESGYRGKIRILIKDGVIEKFEEDTKLR